MKLEEMSQPQLVAADAKHEKHANEGVPEDIKEKTHL
jgi:hypothetical protein